MATTLSGKSGQVTIGGAATYEVSNWTATIEDDLLDATSFDSSGNKEYVVGLKGCTGSLTAIGGTSLPSTNGGAATLSLETGGGSGVGLTISGNAFLQSRGVSVPVDGRVEFTGDFTFTGAVTES